MSVTRKHAQLMRNQCSLFKSFPLVINSFNKHFPSKPVVYITLTRFNYNCNYRLGLMTSEARKHKMYWFNKKKRCAVRVNLIAMVLLEKESQQLHTRRKYSKGRHEKEPGLLPREQNGRNRDGTIVTFSPRLVSLPNNDCRGCPLRARQVRGIARGKLPTRT